MKRSVHALLSDDGESSEVLVSFEIEFEWEGCTYWRFLLQKYQSASTPRRYTPQVSLSVMPDCPKTMSILTTQRQRGHVLLVPDHGDQGMILFRYLGDFGIERLFHEPFLKAGHHYEMREG